LNEAQDRKAIARSTALKLLAYCRSNDWAGYDPYDALNSRVFRTLPFLDFRLARLALTQGIKRSPVNLRPLLLVPKTPNPKGIALFLSSVVRLSRSVAPEAVELISPLADKLLSLRSPGRSQACWGYNFEWQQRFELVSKGSPNIICTTFAGNALLDAHKWTPKPAWPEAAVSAAEFILKDLFSRESRGKACFRYTLVGRDEVHNANLLGAAYLCRAGRISDDKKYFEPALDAARFSVDKQHADGSWAYGEAPTQQWIDNFHTGFNLVALRRIQEYAGTKEFDPAIRKGFGFSWPTSSGGTAPQDTTITRPSPSTSTAPPKVSSPWPSSPISAKTTSSSRIKSWTGRWPTCGMRAVISISRNAPASRCGPLS
jgi:hypothetical protein